MYVNTIEDAVELGQAASPEQLAAVANALGFELVALPEPPKSNADTALDGVNAALAEISANLPTIRTYGFGEVADSLLLNAHFLHSELSAGRLPSAYQR